MVSPQVKREAVETLMRERSFGVTRACGLVQISRSLFSMHVPGAMQPSHFRAERPDDDPAPAPALFAGQRSEKLTELREGRPGNRFGQQEGTLEEPPRPLLACRDDRRSEEAVVDETPADTQGPHRFRLPPPILQVCTPPRAVVDFQKRGLGPVFMR
jgi:hypothetical protein